MTVETSARRGWSAGPPGPAPPCPSGAARGGVGERFSTRTDISGTTSAAPRNATRVGGGSLGSATMRRRCRWIASGSTSVVSIERSSVAPRARVISSRRGGPWPSTVWLSSGTTDAVSSMGWAVRRSTSATAPSTAAAFTSGSVSLPSTVTRSGLGHSSIGTCARSRIAGAAVSRMASAVTSTPTTGATTSTPVAVICRSPSTGSRETASTTSVRDGSARSTDRGRVTGPLPV